MRSCQWTQHQAFYGHLAFEANWKGERSQYVSVSWADQKRKKTNKRCFDVSSLFLHDNNEQFINRAMKSGQLTTGDDQLSGWIEKKHQSTSQSQTCNKKGVLVTLWWSAAGLIHYIFLNPREIIISGNFTQQNECPNAFHITNSSKVELIGLQSFALSATFTWHLANQLPLQASWELFAGKMLPQPAECRKCFLRACQILKHGFLCCWNKQIYQQKCVDCNGSYFD